VRLEGFEDEVEFLVIPGVLRILVVVKTPRRRRISFMRM
jgi:hypothetical protein